MMVMSIPPSACASNSLRGDGRAQKTRVAHGDLGFARGADRDVASVSRIVLRAREASRLLGGGKTRTRAKMRTRPSFRPPLMPELLIVVPTTGFNAGASLSPTCRCGVVAARRRGPQKASQQTREARSDRRGHAVVDDRRVVAVDLRAPHQSASWGGRHGTRERAPMLSVIMPSFANRADGCGHLGGREGEVDDADHCVEFLPVVRSRLGLRRS